MDWIFLIAAGICEWGWPLGLKLGWGAKGAHWGWLAFSVLAMGGSGGLLLLAQKTIPMGTAYAVWTGIGAVGAFVLGILVFGEPATPVRFLFVELIILGIFGLKVAAGQ